MVFTEFCEQLLNCLPDPPLRISAETFSSKSVVIFKPRVFFKGPFCSGNYQFVLPFCDAPDFIIEGKTFPTVKNAIFAINPDQLHSTSNEYEVRGYYSVLIKKEMLQEMAHSIFGKSDLQFKNEFTELTNDLLDLINAFMYETMNQQSGFEFMREGISLQLAVSMIRHIKSNMQLEEKKTVLPRDSIKKAIEFLDDHYNGDFSMDELSQIAGLSPYYLIRVFKSDIGLTPYNYLTNIKIQRVKQKLADKNITISRAFSECGMDHSGHFAALFKKKVGLTPSQYRKLISR